jgi:hypothetical protein
MSTVLDLIAGSLRLLGAVASGESPSASESEDALYALNALIDTWKLESLMVYNISPQAFALVPGQKMYTMGTGGNWNAERPVQIDSMFLQYTGTGTGGPLPLNLPIKLLNQDQYNAIIVPNTASTFPTAAYVSDDFPLRQIFLWPVPQINYSVNVFTWGLIDGFGAITDDIALPPGYERMLRFNLALELAAEFGLTPSQTVAAGALDAKSAVKRNNIKPLFMACDSGVTRRKTGFNWLTGA